MNMKNIYLTSLALGALMMASAPAHAIDSTGCGLGSMAWRGQSGIAPQVLAVTTNGFFSTQTFGITFGTSGCDPNGRVTGGTQKMVLAFMENNMEQFALDAAAGHGETLDTLAGIMNMDKEIVARKAQRNFAALFTSPDIDAVDLTLNFIEVMKA